MSRKYLLGLSLGLFAASSAGAQEALPAAEKLEVPQEVARAIDRSGVVRINSNLAGQVEWRGVRSCDDLPRVRNEFNQAFNRWLGATVRSQPNMRLLGHGWGQITYWYRNRTDSRGRRSCKGGFRSAPVHADFY